MIKTTAEQKVLANRKLVDNFNNLISELEITYPGISNSILMQFSNIDDSSMYNTNVRYVKCKTVWDNNKKDYTILLTQYNIEDGFLYYAPESSVGHIPFIDAVKFFEVIIANYLKDTEKVQSPYVKISKVLLDKFFQNIKCWNIDPNTFKPPESFTSLVNCSSRTNYTSITSLLIRKKMREQSNSFPSSTKSVNYNDSQFDSFCRSLIKIYLRILESLNALLSSIDIKSVEDGFLKTHILINKKSNEFFTSKLFKNIKTFNENIKDANILLRLNNNVIFNPNIRNLLDSFINPKKGFNQGKYQAAYVAASKLYQAVDMLTDYETVLLDVAPTLGMSIKEANTQSFATKFKSRTRSKFILNIGNINGFFDNYKKVKDIPSESALQKAIDNMENIDSDTTNRFTDLTVYQLNDRMLRQLIGIFS